MHGSTYPSERVVWVVLMGSTYPSLSTESIICLCVHLPCIIADFCTLIWPFRRVRPLISNNIFVQPQRLFRSIHPLITYESPFHTEREIHTAWKITRSDFHSQPQQTYKMHTSIHTEQLSHAA